MKQFGFNLKNWREAVVFSVTYTVPTMMLIVLLKIIVLLYTDNFAMNAILTPYASIQHTTSGTLSKLHVWLLTATLYLLLIAPLQEIITRGGIQTSLQNFLVGKYATLRAIVVSNLIFAAIHAYISLIAAVLVFIPGMFCGWIYAKQKTLIAPIISHMLIGFWAIWIVGFEFL